ncbi:hypothetical protein BGX30_001630 [Mortierella sp. GBA39]|nr:hypothetical protein BGX30_001630 [Mortierella sp. GBA39]
MNKAARRRNRRLTPEWRSAHQKVSNNSITHLLSTPELDKVQSERMSTRSVLRNFERNKATVKDRRTREILTKRTYAGLAASQRRFFQDAGADAATTVANTPHHRGPSISPNTEPLIIDGYCHLPDCQQYHTSSHPFGNYHPTNICLLENPKPLPVILHGAAGSGVGSTIKGHARRGGGRFRREHRQHCVVAVTNENLTSKLCCVCFQFVKLATARRLINGAIRSVRINGSVICQNPACPLIHNGTATQNRDKNAAACIALSGFTTLLADDHNPLPPFRLRTRPPRPSLQENSSTNILSNSTSVTSGLSLTSNVTAWIRATLDLSMRAE